jgi:uncharacterized protein (DUF1697 family)
MTTYVALLRAINVGGTHKLPMADLRAACLALGWENPQTFIQSGNLIVDAPAPIEEAQALLAQKLHATLGWMPEIILRTPSAWRAHVSANPFAGAAEINPKIVHLYLTQQPPSPDAARQLAARATAGERAVLAGDALMIDFAGSGIARSRLTPAAIDRACGSPATGRNWNTVLQLSAMLAARTA